MAEERADNEDQGKAEQHGGQTILHEDHVVTVRQDKGAAIVGLHHEAKHHAKHHRKQRHTDIPHGVAEHAEPERHANMEDAGLDRKDPRDDERKDEGHQIGLGPADQPDARSHDQVAHDDHRDVRNEQTQEKTVHNLWILDEEHRTW